MRAGALPRLQLEKVQPGDVRLGEPLAFDVFDGQGRLMLRSGFVLATEAQLERLLEAGMYADGEALAAERALSCPGAVTEGPAASPLELTISVFDTLDAAHDVLAGALRTDSETAGFRARLEETAAAVQRACRVDADAAVGRIFLKRRMPYSIRQSVNVAVLTELMLRPAFPDAGERLPAVLAALTMNISALDLQDTLYGQESPLDGMQQEAVRTHPERSVARLRSLGVDHVEWLEAVEQHHEQPDGSGYPRGLSGQALGRFGRAIGVADRFCALASERAYRPAIPPAAVLRKLIREPSLVDGDLLSTLSREIGAFPPGSFVRLANGETALVVKRSTRPDRPIVRALISAHGVRLEGAPKRSTSTPAFAIVEPVTAPRDSAQWALEQCWTLGADWQPAND